MPFISHSWDVRLNRMIACGLIAPTVLTTSEGLINPVPGSSQLMNAMSPVVMLFSVVGSASLRVPWAVIDCSM